MIKKKVKASTGSGDNKKEFEGEFTYPETFAEAPELLGGEEEALSALVETLDRRYQAQLRGSGKTGKVQALWTKMVEAMVSKGIDQNDAEESASSVTGFIPSESSESSESADSALED